MFGLEEVAGEELVALVDLEVAGPVGLLAFVGGNACLDLVGKAGLQDQNIQAVGDRTAYCNLDLGQSYPAEVRSRGHIVAEDSSHRTEAVEDSPLEKRGIGHDSEAADLDQGVAKDQDEKRSIFQLSIERSTIFPP